MNQSMVMIAAALTLASCKGSGDGELSRHVDFFCSELASGLERAADNYDKFAPALDSGALAADQRSRIAVLMHEGIGISNDARLMKMQEVYKAGLFCISVRDIDQSRENSLQERLAKLQDDLSKQDLDAPDGHHGISHADAAKKLRELAGLAREVSSLPKKQ